MNRLVARQLKKHLGELLTTEASFQSDNFQEFLKAVAQSYDFKDKEMRLLERTIDLNSQELNEANKLLRKQNEEIFQLASMDVLTGLPNRHIFNSKMDEVLKRSMRHNRKFAVMFIDLDRFKVINDSLGHHIGDLLLKNVAIRLTSCIRRTDTVARLGGDEFTILFDEIRDINDTKNIAHKILKELSKPFVLEGHELMITGSIGVSAYPSDGCNVVELFKNADTAMYQAKAIGRNNFVLYHSTMGEKAAAHMELDSKLRKALDRDEFVLHYQPQMDIATGNLCGLEALLRWNSPDLGLVPPIDFIPLAEETGLILPIGEWVLQSACSQNKVWQQSGLKKIRIAINVSYRQLHNSDFISSIDSALKMFDLEPECLEIELTESSVMQNPDISMNVLRRINAKGIYLSIDDFGTGYSSLSTLRKFTINKLKIDKSFIQDIENNPDAQAIIGAIIAMSHSLNLDVIAEGVETQAQLKFLKEKKCNQIQGYLISKPKPAGEIEPMLKESYNFPDSH